MNVSRESFARAYAQRKGISIAKAMAACDEFFDHFVEQIEQLEVGEKLYIRGFGLIYKREIPEKDVRLPTGEVCHCPRKEIYKFTKSSMVPLRRLHADRAKQEEELIIKDDE